MLGVSLLVLNNLQAVHRLGKSRFSRRSRQRTKGRLLGGGILIDHKPQGEPVAGSNKVIREAHIVMGCRVMKGPGGKMKAEYD